MSKHLIINFPDEESRKSFVGSLDLMFMEDEYSESEAEPHKVYRKLITYQMPDKCEEGELNETELFYLLLTGSRTMPWENSTNRRHVNHV
tara:strand:+ start:152 stop:421 length:270 start_codon:yes stop_codon:yes gene_type:complete